MKTASQIIAEMDAEHARHRQVAAEELEQSVKMLDWLFEQLKSAAVSVKFGGPRVHKVWEIRDGKAAEGSDLMVCRHDRILCQLIRSYNGVRVIPEDSRTAEDCADGERALRKVLEVLRADVVKHPQDDRDPPADVHKPYEPVSARI